MGTLPALRRSLDLLKTADLPAAKELRDKAQAIERYLRRSKDAQKLCREAAEIKIRAERRIGELLRESVKRGRPRKGSGTEPFLDALKISKTQSHRYQQIATLPAETFDDYATNAREPSTAGVLKLVVRHVRDQQTGPASGGNIYTCDLAELPVQDQSADLIFTDPR
jgi:hypothetical protein